MSTPSTRLLLSELLEDLRDLIWSHYAAQLHEEYRELYREPSDSLEPGASSDDPDDRSF